MNKVYCDVWHGEGVMVNELLALNEAKRIMKRLYKEGKECIRMYATYDDGRMFYYSFDKTGKIYKEDNNLTN